MTAGRHDDTTPLFVGDMSPPAIVLHFAPVALAIFCLTMSLADYSVSRCFAEDRPGAWMSLFLMFCVLVLVLPAMRNTSLSRGRRILAVILSVAGGCALWDEKNRWHEALGSYLAKTFTFASTSLLYYADDIILICLSLGCWALLACWMRKSNSSRGCSGYLWCVGGLAVLHGLLDVLSHGREHLWKAAWPELSTSRVREAQLVLGYFEESSKLWCEWFVILFLLAFFYGMKGELLWSLEVCIGSFVATAGLWGTEDPHRGIPYVVMEATLRYLRNPHLLFVLGTIWLIWAAVVWWQFGGDDRARSAAGLFFLTPLCLLLPEMAGDIRGVAGACADIVGNRAYLVAAVVVSGLLGVAARCWTRPVLVGVSLLVGMIGFSLSKAAAQPLALLEAGGILLPAAVAVVVQRSDNRTMAIIIVLLCAGLIQSALWLVSACGVLILLVIPRLKNAEIRLSRRTWAVLVLSQLLVIVVLILVDMNPFIGCERFRPPEKVLFQIGYQ